MLREMLSETEKALVAQGDLFGVQKLFKVAKKHTSLASREATLGELRAQSNLFSLVDGVFCEELITFSDEELVWIHWRLIEDALEILGRQDALPERQEVLEWIFGDDLGGSQKPCSFSSCCKLFGLRAEQFQTALMPMARELFNK